MKEKRVLIWTDLHKWDKDFQTIGGYVKAVEKVHEELCDELERGDYYATISTGDIHHGGYRSPALQFSHMNRHKRMHDAVDGRYYVTLGNHFYLERDQNPTMYLIQPHPTIKPIQPVYSEKPIIQAPDYIIIDNVQISFFHYDKTNKEYVRKREPGVRAHIGIFHDDKPLPQSIRDDLHQYAKVESSYLNRVYEDIDLAIFGHIHNKIGTKVIHLENGKKVPIIIPGSLGITSSNIDQRHRSVLLPVLVIRESGVAIEYFEQPTHLELLKFYKSQASLDKGTLHEELQHTTAKTSLNSTFNKKIIDSHLGIISYLQERGYKQKTIELVSKASSNSLSVTEAMEIFTRKSDF